MYYDREGHPIPVTAWPSPDERRVDRTQVSEGVSVSTVHLVLDHSFDDGPPVIFETMIFGGEHDQDQWRYHPGARGRAGHDAVVAWLRGEGPEPDGPDGTDAG